MEIIANVRYEKLAEIGGLAGQNSRVFRVFDHHLGTELVVKEVKKARIGDAARYFAEAQAVHASAHPRVVPIRWAAERADEVCLAMPFMPGGSLADAIRETPLKPSLVIRVAQDLCEGVGQIHVAKYLHLDIKPTNVLFDAAGRAAVTDFGLALKVDYSGTADARDAELYPSFRPPEHIKGGILTHAADVYQIALTLYRAANGEPYFKEQWDAHSAEPWPAARDAVRDGRFPDRSFLPSVPQRLRLIIKKALDTDPAKRPIGARALAEEIAKVEVRYDWSTEQYGEERAVWRLQLRGRADMVVSREGRPPQARIEIFSQSENGRRRALLNSWAQGLRTRRQITQALSRAFRAVEKHVG